MSTSTGAADICLARGRARPTKAFEPHGAVAIYTTPPPGEETPQYPSPAGHP